VTHSQCNARPMVSFPATNTATVSWPVLISHPIEGRRLNLCELLVAYQVWMCDKFVNYWLLVQLLCPTRHKIGHFGDVPQAKLLAWYGKNLTQQKHTFTNQKKCTTTQNKHKKLKPVLVTSDDIQPGNGEGLFWFRHFINLTLTYLDTYSLTYSPGPTRGSNFLTAHHHIVGYSVPQLEMRVQETDQEIR